VGPAAVTSPFTAFLHLPTPSAARSIRFHPETPRAATANLGLSQTPSSWERYAEQFSHLIVTRPQHSLCIRSYFCFGSKIVRNTAISVA
jgi:hypothetical protein